MSAIFRAIFASSLFTYSSLETTRCARDFSLSLSTSALFIERPIYTCFLSHSKKNFTPNLNSRFEFTHKKSRSRLNFTLSLCCNSSLTALYIAFVSVVLGEFGFHPPKRFCLPLIELIEDSKLPPQLTLTSEGTFENSFRKAP